jgi:hypothetical protein
MAEGRRCMITFEQFARLFGFGQNIANCHKIHYTLHFDASKMRFIFPRNKRGSVGTTTDLLPFYAFLTLFGRRSRKYRRALSRVMVMYPTLCIWLRGCWNHTFGWDKKHHPLRIKNDLRAAMKERRATAPRVLPPRAASGRGKQGDKHHLLSGRGKQGDNVRDLNLSPTTNFLRELYKYSSTSNGSKCLATPFSCWTSSYPLLSKANLTLP